MSDPRPHIHAARYFQPYLRLFPIWRFGPRYDSDGRYVDDGWYPDRFGKREGKP